MASAQTGSLAERCERLMGVIRLQTLIAKERESDQLPSLVMRNVTQLMGAERGTLFMYDGTRHELRPLHADGVAQGMIVVPLKMGVIGAAIVRRQCINIVNAREHAFFNDITERRSGYRTDTLLAQPIVRDDGQVLGGLELINKFGGRFTPDHESKLASTASRLAGSSTEGSIDPHIAREEISALQAEIGCDRSSVYQLNEKTGYLASIYASGTEEIISVRTKLGIAGSVVLTGKTLLVSDPYNDVRFDPSYDRSTGYTTRDILSVPLGTATSEMLGAIQVVNSQRGGFTEDDVGLLETIAGIVAIAFESRNLIRDLDQQFHSLLDVLAATLDSRDELTSGHSHRVARLAVGIAAALGFDEEDRDILKVAGMLHDYGKIGVDDAVLRKKGKLDAGEYRHMKTHASMTFDILDRVHFADKYRSVPLIASSHHEALDGSGYPRGLYDNEIPIMAKILTVADVFEALTADRHYRNGMSVAKAFRILEAGIGTKFDGRIVQALKQSLDENGGTDKQP